MGFTNRLASRFDALQQRYAPVGFVVAVIKKYGRDQANYQAALLTYFGFLSLFPLLLVLTTILQLVLKNDSQLSQQIISSTTSYFPIIGQQLQEHIHSFSRAGWALVIGFLITLYGAKGGADAFRHAVNHIWHIPSTERDNFVHSLAKSFGIILVGGAGFILAAVVAGYAAGIHHALPVRLILLLVDLAILFGAFLFVMKVSLAKVTPVRKLWLGAAIAAIGLLFLQSVGGYIITHELKNLTSLYGTFATVLGLLFWLYLQTQLLVWAIEVDTVKAMKVWPRPLSGNH
jgi:YihY family inner membrane protein